MRFWCFIFEKLFLSGTRGRAGSATHVFSALECVKQPTTGISTRRCSRSYLRGQFVTLGSCFNGIRAFDLRDFLSSWPSSFYVDIYGKHLRLRHGPRRVLVKLHECDDGSSFENHGLKHYEKRFIASQYSLGVQENRSVDDWTMWVWCRLVIGAFKTDFGWF